MLLIRLHYKLQQTRNTMSIRERLRAQSLSVAATVSAHVEQKHESPQGTKVTHQKTDFTAVWHIRWRRCGRCSGCSVSGKRRLRIVVVVVTVSSGGTVVKRWSVRTKTEGWQCWGTEGEAVRWVWVSSKSRHAKCWSANFIRSKC